MLSYGLVEGELWIDPAMSGNDFWTSGTGTGNGKFHSHFRERECECEWQIPFPFSGTGMQINRKFHSRLSGTENSREFPGNSREIPGKFHSHLRERECKWKIPFPFSGTGMRVANSIPDFRDGNWRPVFPGIPGIGNSRSWLFVGRLRLSSHIRETGKC